MLHDHVLCANWVRRVIVPIQHSWDGDACINMFVTQHVRRFEPFDGSQSEEISFDLLQAIVATSEFVTSRDGPAAGKGTLATTLVSLLSRTMNARLKLPSAFEHCRISLAPGTNLMALWQSAGKSNLTRRASRGAASAHTQRPLVNSQGLKPKLKDALDNFAVHENGHVRISGRLHRFQPSAVSTIASN